MPATLGCAAVPGPLPGAPTPPIAIEGGAGRRRGAPRRARGSRCPTTSSTACAAPAPTVDDRPGRAGRGEPRLVAARHVLVDRAARSPPWPTSCAGPADAAEVAAVLAVCNAARIPVTAAAGRSGVLGGSVPVHGGVVLDLTGLVGHRRRRRHLDGARRAGRHLRHAARGRRCAPSTASPSATGRSRSTCPPSAAGSPAAAPASSRTATGRSRTSSSASTSCSPTAARSPPAAPPARRSAPTSTSSSSAARARSASSPAPASASTRARRTTGRRRGASPPSPPPSTPSAGSCSAARHPAVLRLYDATEAARSYHTPEGMHLLLAYDEGDAALVEVTLAHRRRGVRGRRRRRRSTPPSSTTGWRSATTSPPSRR